MLREGLSAAMGFSFNDIDMLYGYLRRGDLARA